MIVTHWDFRQPNFKHAESPAPPVETGAQPRQRVQPGFGSSASSFWLFASYCTMPEMPDPPEPESVMKCAPVQLGTRNPTALLNLWLLNFQVTDQF
jgi:hypothetical protein